MLACRISKQSKRDQTRKVFVPFYRQRYNTFLMSSAWQALVEEWPRAVTQIALYVLTVVSTTTKDLITFYSF